MTSVFAYATLCHRLFAYERSLHGVWALAGLRPAGGPHPAGASPVREGPQTPKVGHCPPPPPSGYVHVCRTFKANASYLGKNEDRKEEERPMSMATELRTGTI